MPSKASHDDTDLDALLTETASSTKKQGTTPSLFSEKDYMTNVDCIGLTWAYLSFLCSYHKKAAVAAVCLFALLLVLGFIVTTSYKPPVIEHDYSNIQSILDLKLGKVDHWCLNGGDVKCSCADPLDPEDAAEKGNWMKAHKKNKKNIKALLNNGVDVDVAFVGDAVTEIWAGRVLGDEEAEIPGETKKKDGLKAKMVARVFNRSFKGENALIKGIPLGIAGDMSPNILWRLMNGEMEGLYPKVWWIMTGMVDLARHSCSEEVVLLGILRVVEEIRKQRPSAIIVISGLIPTTTRKNGSLIVPQEKHRRFEKWSNADLWPSIQLINYNLERFAEKHKGIKYFDPLEVFTQERKNGNKFLDPRLKHDKVHPSLKGYRFMTKAIEDRLREILKLPKRKEKTDDEVDDP